MPNTDFEKAYAFVRSVEGGKVDNPKDPGGRTAYGVTQKVYDEVRKAAGQHTRDVFLIEENELHDIYHRFWELSDCDTLEFPLNLVHFDTAFHSGQGNASKFLNAVLWMNRESYFRAYAYLVARRAYLLRLNNKTFERGWLNRIDALRKAAGLA